MVSNETKKDSKVIEIAPISKGKRVLLFLADFFLNFIVTIFFYNMIVLQCGQAATGYNDQLREKFAVERERYDILYGNKILFYEEKTPEETEKYDINKNLSSTCRKFTTYYVFDDGSVSVENEVMNTYFTDIKNNRAKLIEIYKECDKNTNFFEFSDDINELPKLKDEYKEEFKPIFDPLDEPTEKGAKDYNKFLNSFFLEAYSKVLEDINENDLTYDGVSKSYKELTVIMKDKESYGKGLIITCVYISYIISVLILFVGVPLIKKDGRTLAERIMKVETLTFDGFKPLRISQILMNSIYQIIAGLAFVFIVPYPETALNEVFKLSELYVVSFIVIILLIASAIYMLFDRYNRVLSDVCSRTLKFDSGTLDDILRAKGYQI